MSSNNKAFKGDIGTKIQLDAGSDISTGDVFKIYYEKPNGVTGIWPAELEGTQIIYYITLTASDLDQVGEWKFQIYVELPTPWKGRGDIASLQVYDKIAEPEV